MKELPKAYSASQYERSIYEQWERSGYFNPDNLPASSAPFSISLPPPNATGTLHLGHAIMVAVQDLLIRFERLRGKKTLWLPGTDHAAIATQNVVEKQLWQQEHKTRFDLPRDEFVRRVTAYAEQSKSTIRAQIRAVGASCDWSRERYTLDGGLSRAVREVFVRLYRDGLLYRGERIVNWCYRCGTTLADDEVEYKETKGKLYYLRYGPVEVATTRPETKLGDTALAVNPDDERYQHLVGQEFDVTLGKVAVHVKVIADKTIDRNFGTGVVGVTPAHSLADFDLAQKYHLPVRQVIGQDGKMTPAAGPYAGFAVKQAREQFIHDLGAQVTKIEDYTYNLSVCYRCGTPVEPLPSEQWFVAVDKPFRLSWLKKSTLKQLAFKAVRSGQVRIIPDRFNKVYFQWMENLHDWCVSRQIWFGHRIPAWRCPQMHWHVTADEPVHLTVIRHGLTDWNEQERIQGLTDVPLDEHELGQTYELAKRLEAKGKADVIITSPLARARQTAAILAESLHCPVVEEERLHERYYGAFEGKLVADIKQTDPAYYKDKIAYPIPGAETYSQIEARLTGWLRDVLGQYRGKSVVVVAHTSIMRALRALLDNANHQELSDYRPQLAEPLERQVVGRCARCGSWALQQDPDTLDTWFSSSLWTFSTLGWPEQTLDLRTFHPTSVMETGYDILFFWVARMVLMSQYAVRQVPFRTVYLHGLVRDKQGRKMSKSLGNGIDPVEMIQKYGADALRLSMVIGTTPGNDFRLYEEKIAGYRNFVNKLWNISRFALLSVAEPKLVETPPSATTLADRWILSRFGAIANLVTDKIQQFEFSEAGEALYDFTWHELADWYLEVAKIEGSKDEILCYLLTQLLKLWHPYTPFVTETLWREAFGTEAGLLMVARWPQQLPATEAAAEADFKLVQDVVSAIRTYRIQHKLANGDQAPIDISGLRAKVVQDNMLLIKKLRTNVSGVAPAGADWVNHQFDGLTLKIGPVDKATKE